MSETQVESLQRVMQPRRDHERILAERATRLCDEYLQLEVRLYTARREILHLLPELERCRSALDDDISAVRTMAVLERQISKRGAK